MADGVPLPNRIEAVFNPTDEELISRYSTNGYTGLIGTIPFVGNMYISRPEEIHVQGAGEIHEEEDNGLLTITTEWLVVTYKCVGHENHVSGGVWITDRHLVPLRDGLDNQIIGNSKIIRYFEEGRTSNFWAAVELMPLNDQAQMVACRLIKREVLPTFSTSEWDASLTFDELIEGNLNADENHVDE